MKDIDEMVHGEVYFVNYDGDEYILNYHGMHQPCDYIHINGSEGSYFSDTSNWGWSTDELSNPTLRVATDQEKSWLLACMEVNGFVDKKDVIINPVESLDIF